VLFVGALALVVGSVRSVYRGGRELAGELSRLSEDVEHSTGSARSGSEVGRPPD
jgi:hypothetical protein